MKSVTIVGARPQFIKAAAGSRQLRKEHQEILVHTGQHFDENMSEVFFEEMHIPKPDYNLGISGGTHAQMTARMLVGIEEILMKEQPDALLVYFDGIWTNRSMTSHFRDSIVLYGDSRIITMSTCIGGQPDMRYLVQAVLLNP